MWQEAGRICQNFGGYEALGRYGFIRPGNIRGSLVSFKVAQIGERRVGAKNF